MIFEKDMQFLGMQANQMSDGGVYYAVSLFDSSENAPLVVNVGGGKASEHVIDGLLCYKFGEPIHVTFSLRKTNDKGYRLSIAHV